MVKFTAHPQQGKQLIRSISRLLLFAGLLLLPTLVTAAPATAVPQAALLDLQSLIDAAAPGTVLTIEPGIYQGPIVVDKPLHLIGQSGPDGQATVIDGGGNGSVLTIRAAGTTVESFVIRNSGNVIDKEDAGIVVENVADVQLIGNRVEDVLYGIKGLEAHRLLLRNNHIIGRALDVARRGDGIRLWQSEECVVEGNTVEQTRDILFWFSDRSIVRGNHFHHNRYGIHMMYTDGMQVLSNSLNDNSVGVYLMYSVDVLIQDNTLQGNRGPSGYGVALKDMDAATIRDNYFLDNRVGLFFDNSPARVEIEQAIERNVLAYNDVGVLMMPAVHRNLLRQNTFIDNLEQVGVKGGGSQEGDQLGGNQWDGNFWSDYVGYDSDGQGVSDGIGDLPYRSERLFENLADRHPYLRLFHFSPIEVAVDLAAQAFPVIKPKPKLTDAIPLMAPQLPATAPQISAPVSRIGWLALGLLAAAMLLLWSPIYSLLGRVRPGAADPGHSRARFPVLPPRAPAPVGAHPTALPTRLQAHEQDHARCHAHHEEQTMISVEHLYKRYPQPGRPWWSDATITAVDDLSFHVHRGQALGLWGSNGAGKTTALKCLLGLLECEGELRINGLDLRRDGRKARNLLGYVPQELAFHAGMSVLETCHFYANLKHVSTARIPVVLEQVGLAEQLSKRVGALSGGMKQRLALALALLADPPVLMLDEPTSNLDAATRSELLALLAGLRDEGKALLFTSHHIAEVEQLANQVLLLQDGRLVAQGNPAQLMPQLMPERELLVRQIKVVVADGQQPRAQQVLANAGYTASPNGHGLWVSVAPERKAEPLGVLYSAAVEVIDVEL